MESVAKILLVGSHATLIGSIAARLEYEHHCTVVGAIGSPSQVAKMLAEQAADIVLMDMDGVERKHLSSLRVLRAAHPDLRIILISATVDDARIEQALKVGANGFMAKDALPTTIARAIREVLAGGAHFPDGIRSRIVLDSCGLRLAESTTEGEDHHVPE